MSDDHESHDDLDPGIDCTPEVENPACFGCMSASLHKELDDCASRLEDKLEAFEVLIEELNGQSPIPPARAIELGKITGVIAAAAEMLRDASDYWDNILDDAAARAGETVKGELPN
jgi:hypothetical protein